MLDADAQNAALAARIRKAIKDLPLSKAEVAERLGVTPQAITGWETKGRIGKQSLAGLANLTGLPLQHFLGGAAANNESDWADITGYAQGVGLGKGTEAQEYAETHKLKFRADSLHRKRLNPHKLHVMYGDGDSMQPRVSKGDAILFDESDKSPRDGKLFVIEWRGEIYVKRCEVIDDLVYFRADNPAGDHQWKKPKRVDSARDPISVIGRVRWIGSWED